MDPVAMRVRMQPCKILLPFPEDFSKDFFVFLVFPEPGPSEAVSDLGIL